MRDFYYLEKRSRRNVLVGPMHPQEMIGFRALKECHLHSFAIQAGLWVAEHLSEERALQCAMLADAADSSLACTRKLDAENTDPACLSDDISIYRTQMHSLFVQGRCVHDFGFTKTMMGRYSSASSAFEFWNVDQMFWIHRRGVRQCHPEMFG